LEIFASLLSLGPLPLEAEYMVYGSKKSPSYLVGTESFTLADIMIVFDFQRQNQISEQLFEKNLSFFHFSRGIEGILGGKSSPEWSKLKEKNTHQRICAYLTFLQQMS
jgi:hypothetical protein